MPEGVGEQMAQKACAKGVLFFKTTRDARAFRDAKTPFFRKRGVSNFSGVAIRVMFSVL